MSRVKTTRAEPSLACRGEDRTQAPWAQSGLTETVSPRRDVADTAEPWHEAIGPNEGGRLGRRWNAELGKLQHG